MNNEEQKIQIKIVDTRAKKTVKTAVWFIALFIVPISIGVLLDSAAMQWVGFVGFLFFISMLTLVRLGLIAYGDERTTDLIAKKFTSVNDAIAYLEGLDKWPAKTQ